MLINVAMKTTKRYFSRLEAFSFLKTKLKLNDAAYKQPIKYVKEFA